MPSSTTTTTHHALIHHEAPHPPQPPNAKRRKLPSTATILSDLCHNNPTASPLQQQSVLESTLDALRRYSLEEHDESIRGGMVNVLCLRLGFAMELRRSSFLLGSGVSDDEHQHPTRRIITDDDSSEEGQEEQVYVERSNVLIRHLCEAIHLLYGGCSQDTREASFRELGSEIVPLLAHVLDGFVSCIKLTLQSSKSIWTHAIGETDVLLFPPPKMDAPAGMNHHHRYQEHSRFQQNALLERDIVEHATLALRALSKSDKIVRCIWTMEEGVVLHALGKVLSVSVTLPTNHSPPPSSTHPSTRSGQHQQQEERFHISTKTKLATLDTVRRCILHIPTVDFLQTLQHDDDDDDDDGHSQSLMQVMQLVVALAKKDASPHVRHRAAETGRVLLSTHFQEAVGLGCLTGRVSRQLVDFAASIKAIMVSQRDGYEDCGVPGQVIQSMDRHERNNNNSSSSSSNNNNSNKNNNIHNSQWSSPHVVVKDGEDTTDNWIQLPNQPHPNHAYASSSSSIPYLDMHGPKKTTRAELEHFLQTAHDFLTSDTKLDVILGSGIQNNLALWTRGDHDHDLKLRAADMVASLARRVLREDPCQDATTEETCLEEDDTRGESQHGRGRHPSTLHRHNPQMLDALVELTHSDDASCIEVAIHAILHQTRSAVASRLDNHAPAAIHALFAKSALSALAEHPGLLDALAAVGSEDHCSASVTHAVAECFANLCAHGANGELMTSSPDVLSCLVGMVVVVSSGRRNYQASCLEAVRAIVRLSECVVNRRALVTHAGLVACLVRFVKSEGRGGGGGESGEFEIVRKLVKDALLKLIPVM